MANGFKAAVGGLSLPYVNTCLVFISEVLATPQDSPVMTFIFILTFFKMASESDHYTSNLRCLCTDKLVSLNNIVILLIALVFPTFEKVNLVGLFQPNHKGKMSNHKK